LHCNDNQLSCLNVKNNTNQITSFDATNNPNLNCIEVDDSVWATVSWTDLNGSIDATAFFSTNCNNACSSCNMTVSASATGASCSTCADGTAAATGTGGTGPYTYSWNTTPVQTSSTATGLLPYQWYCVSLTDSAGCTGNACSWVGDSSCIASFTYVVYGQDSVVFTNTSTGTGQFNIAFGDGNILNGWTSTNLTHVYVSPGTYNVCLIDSGCMDTYCDSVVIAGCNMTVSASATGASCSTCADGTATATGTGGTGPYTYSWNTTPVQTSSTATGLLPGWYTVYVTDSIGCNANDWVKVCDSSYNLSFTYVVYGQDSVVFTNTSTGNGFYALYFGDGNYQWNWAQSSSITHVYAAPGAYNVCLNDTLNNLSCMGQNAYCDSVVIVDTTSGSPCNASFYPYVDPVQTNTVYLIENSTGNNLAYFWDFDDGNTSTQQYPTHVYTSFGTYNLCLTVSDTVSSCQDTYCMTLTIDSVQKVFFEYTVIVVPGIPLGIEQEDASLPEIIVYPNPATSKVNVELTGYGSSATLTLFNVVGQVLTSETISLDPGKSIVKLDLRSYPDGLYFIQVNSAKSKEIIRISKMN